MIAVWCMNTNDHAPQREVDILECMVDRHLSLPHEFICITESDLLGWWAKVRLFGSNSRARNLWLDLDVAITGSLDGLVVPLSSDIRTGKNWAQSGHGGCQSSVMYWEGDACKIINDEFDPAIAHWPPRNEPGVLWGDQEWITQLRDEKRLAVEYFSPVDVVSYKYHCRDVMSVGPGHARAGLPNGAKVVVFHGKPRPYEVSDKWVMDARECND